ncbi:Cytochrome P450 82A3 [Acorus calamus]|uniref:Cytochrome P450 82A3 n=1 Tax=Acorus calamus TaxID=4465 RepID=A0AAV9EVL8_ACOCL|nr:Cytochrome P450 82A3 [Acorus calamus]
MGGLERLHGRDEEDGGEMDSLLVGWLEEHRNRRLHGGEVEWDFMDLMLSIIDKAELSMR